MDATAWDQRYAAADLVWSRGPNEWVAARLADLAPAEALDLGCGEGRNALWLASRGWRVTALDFSEVAVDRGRRLAAEAGLEVTWHVGDVLTAPLPEVDLVVLAYLQLPQDQRRSVVRRAWDRLRPGGTFLLVAHDTSNLTEGTGGPQDPAVLMTAEDVLGDLTGPGRPGGSELVHEVRHEVVHAGRVARRVQVEDGHGGTAEQLAWDVVVHLVRR